MRLLDSIKGTSMTLRRSTKPKKPYRYQVKGKRSSLATLVEEQPEILPLAFKKDSISIMPDEKVIELFNTIIPRLQSKEKKNCVWALEEIYTSEVKYVRQLRCLLQVREKVRSIKRNQLCRSLDEGKKCRHGLKRTKCSGLSGEYEPVVSQEDVDKMFINIQAIQAVHSNIMNSITKALVKHQARVKKSNRTSVTVMMKEVCKIYTQTAPYWAMYTDYFQRFETAMATLQRIRTEDVDFASKTNEIEELFEVTLRSLINKPLQRITKYPLLFFTLENNVKKLIKSRGAAYKGNLNDLALDLANVSSIIHQAVHKVNKKVGIASDMKELVRINTEFNNAFKTFSLLKPWRRVKMETTLEHFEFGNLVDYPSTCFLFVFNDMIVVGREDKRSPSFAARSSIRRTLAPVSIISAPASKKSDSKVSSNSHVSSNQGRHLTKSRNFKSSFMTLTRSVNSRKSALPAIQQGPKQRNLVCLAEIKIAELFEPIISKEKEEEEEIFCLSVVYDYYITDDDVVVKFYFKTEKECIELRDLIKSLQTESKIKQKEHASLIKRVKSY